MLQSMKAERRIIVIGAVVVSSVLVLTTVALRAYAVFRLATEQALIKSQFQTLLLDQKTRDDSLRKELDAIELTLYANPSPPTTAVTSTVVPPLAARRESSVETIVYGQIKELRERLTVLERWRLQVDRDLR